MRESAAEKGSRYLVEGRLTIERADFSTIRATCRGSGAVYRVGWNGRDWHCDCPALTRCAHLVALQAVTVARDSGQNGTEH